MDHKVFPPPPQHQVFINFRGEELRNNFISHLVDAFQRNEINTFTDKKEQKGEDISKLFKRIEQSKIAIVVFSKRYTESRWCLDELVKIKEHVDLGNLKVLPIFYNVTPDHVKLIEGDFGFHFRHLGRMYRHEKPKIDKWKEALACISDKIGLTFDDKSLSESDFIGNIIKDILIMLQSIPSSQVQNSIINTLPIKEETSTIIKKDSTFENSLINTLPIKEKTSSKLVIDESIKYFFSYDRFHNSYGNSIGKGETSSKSLIHEPTRANNTLVQRENSSKSVKKIFFEFCQAFKEEFF